MNTHDMKTTVRFLSLAAIAVCIVAAPAVEAHDLWLSRTGDGAGARVVVNYGHPGDRPPPLADKVLEIEAITRDGKTSLIGKLAPAVVDDTFVLTAPDTGGAELLAARYDNGFWVQTADGSYRNSSKLMYPDARKGMWSVKFAKAITGRDAPWSKVLGHELELVPLSDPAAAAPGQMLRVKVLFRGRPLAGVLVERGDGVTAMAENDIPKFRSDATGIVAIPLVKAGPHLLAIDHEVKPARLRQLADSDLYNATLAFPVAVP